MKQVFVIPLIAISVFSFAQSKAKFVEKVEKKDDELIIPYEKYILDNGLIVIVHEDHSDPVCHVDVTYHVGSDREQVGRSGFAHFFEHMMFQGSDHVGDDQHFKIVTESGGSLNGTTNSDRTNYFETLPSNQLETALWLEADRMGFLLDAVTQQKFEIQRATVKNERGQNFDNRPYGLVGEKTGEALYPYGHPYSWTTIGYIEDLNRVDANDLKKFFLRWYGPNNAVLTIAGDVKTSDVIKMVEKYFAPIPKGPEVKPIAKQLAVLDKDRYISYEDKIRFPLLHIAFPSVNVFHPDDAPLDVLASVLSEGKTSLFYQTFIKPQIAMEANVYNSTSEVAGQFVISIKPFKKTLAQMDSMVRAALVEFEKRGVSDDDLVRFKAKYEAGVINSLGSVRGKATQLAFYQTFTGDANYIQKDIGRYMKVTKEDVMRVFKQYIKNKPAVILSVYPKGQPQLVAKPDNYQAPKRDIANVKEGEEYKNLVYNKAKDNFDRSIQPKPGPVPVVKVPDFWNEKFANGLGIMGAKNDEIPTVTILLNIEAGHRFESKDKSGIAMLTANLMNEATVNHTAEQISDQLSRLGSSIDVSAGENQVSVTINSLKKNVDATLKLVEEILLHPKFDKTDFDRSKNEQVQLIADQSTKPVVIAGNVYNKLLYGDNNIMSVPTIGTAQTLTPITLDDVKNYYNKNFVSSVSQLIVVGDLNKDEALSKLAFLKTWKDGKVERPIQVSSPAIDKTKLFFVNKEKAAQSEIRIGYLALPYDATGDYYKCTIMNYAFGGAPMNNRINMNLREGKGWTYGAGAGFNGNKFIGPWTARSGVKADETDSSVIEFMKEIKNYRENGITDKELEFTKMSISQNEALRYETPAQKAGFLQRMLYYNLDKNFVTKQNEILKGITKTEIDALAKKHLPYDRMNIVVVGDKARVYDKLTKLGYDVIELDTDGKSVNGR